MRLLVLARRKCEALLGRLVKGLEVENVEADEMWSFVAMKERTKTAKGITDPEVGDSYTYLAMERDSKLILTHYVGPRTWQDAEVFVSKLAKATAGPFQLTTDGFDGYPYAVTQHLGHRVDYAQLSRNAAPTARASGGTPAASNRQQAEVPHPLPGPGHGLHQPRREAESVGQDAHSALQPADQRLLEEGRRTSGRRWRSSSPTTTSAGCTGPSG